MLCKEITKENFSIFPYSSESSNLHLSFTEVPTLEMVTSVFSKLINKWKKLTDLSITGHITFQMFEFASLLPLTSLNISAQLYDRFQISRLPATLKSLTLQADFDCDILTVVNNWCPELTFLDVNFAHVSKFVYPPKLIQLIGTHISQGFIDSILLLPPSFESVVFGYYGEFVYTPKNIDQIDISKIQSATDLYEEQEYRANYRD